MVASGWVAEVESLLEAAGRSDLPAFQAIGYRQLIRYLHGEWGLIEALDDTVRATRRYAKRQQTWFRKQPGITWFRREELATSRRLSAELDETEDDLGLPPEPEDIDAGGEPADAETLDADDELE